MTSWIWNFTNVWSLVLARPLMLHMSLQSLCHFSQLLIPHPARILNSAILKLSTPHFSPLCNRQFHHLLYKREQRHHLLPALVQTKLFASRAIISFFPSASMNLEFLLLYKPHISPYVLCHPLPTSVTLSCQHIGASSPCLLYSLSKCSIIIYK